MAEPYRLLLTDRQGTIRDITELVSSLTWSGNVRQMPRELRGTLAVPRDGSVDPPALDEGSILTLQHSGQALYTGPLTSVTTESQSIVVDFDSMDRAFYLEQNEGWYQFNGNPPEEIVRAICQDYGIPVGSLAAAGTAIRRKFPGVSLGDIMATAYTMAGEENGKRYILRFTGEGALEVREKPTAAGYEIRVTQSVATSWSIESLQNSVAIYSDTGDLLGRVSDEDSVAINGLLEHAISQQNGTDAQAEAQAYLTDHETAQKLTVEVPGDTRLITGEAVILRDTGLGVSGLFWIDSDTHTWKNGQHFTKLTLNFRNLMNETSAGGEL